MCVSTTVSPLGMRTCFHPLTTATLLSHGHVARRKWLVQPESTHATYTGGVTIAPPLPTPFQPYTAALTSAAHTHPQAYVFASSAYHISTLPALLQFLHKACFIPVVDTWCKAIDAEYFTTCPCLTSKTVRKDLPVSIDTAKVHLRLTHQHVQSTRDQTTRTLPP